jgi:hypothetical protein
VTSHLNSTKVTQFSYLPVWNCFVLTYKKKLFSVSDVWSSQNFTKYCLKSWGLARTCRIYTDGFVFQREWVLLGSNGCVWRLWVLVMRYDVVGFWRCCMLFEGSDDGVHIWRFSL